MRMNPMERLFNNKKYGGILWHMVYSILFIGFSRFFLGFTKGTTWYLISTALRIIFGIEILWRCGKLLEKTRSEILSFRNTGRALAAGAGFLLFFVYYLIAFFSGFGKIVGLSTGLLISRILLQQIATGFYEEINCRFLFLEGLRYTKNTPGMKLLYVLGSSVLFGLLHCVFGWNTYTFLQAGAIGLAFAVIFVCSGNIVIPMLLHFIYDVFANTAAYIEWNHTPLFDDLNSLFSVMLAVMAAISLFILIFYDRRRDPVQPESEQQDSSSESDEQQG